MADVKTSFTMSTTSTAGKKSSKAITNINEQASDGKIRNLAVALNNITTNELTDVTKITKKEIEAGTYADLTIEVDKSNDSGNAINITGTTINVDYSKIGDISNIFEMPRINVVSKLNNQNISVAYYTETTGYMPGMFLDLNSPIIYITNPGDSVGTGSTVKIIIKDGIYNGTKYNGATVTINFF